MVTEEVLHFKVQTKLQSSAVLKLCFVANVLARLDQLGTLVFNLRLRRLAQ